MHYRDPNRPESGFHYPGADDPRKLEDRVGHAAKDGYTLHYRRPRVRHYTESIDPERADQIESLRADMPRTRGY